MALTTTWYILPPIDQLCLHCPIPGGCREGPHCPYHLAKATGNVSHRKPIPREIQVLNYLERHPDWHRAIDIAHAIDAPPRTTLYTLTKLHSQGKVARIGERHTLRWKTNASTSAS